MRRSPLYRATTILLNKGLMVKRNIFMFCRPSTEKLSIGILATLASMCEAVFWPPYLKLFLKVVLRYGTFNFEGDFWIHDFDHFLTHIYSRVQVQLCVKIGSSCFILLYYLTSKPYKLKRCLSNKIFTGTKERLDLIIKVYLPETEYLSR